MIIIKCFLKALDNPDNPYTTDNQEIKPKKKEEAMSPKIFNRKQSRQSSLLPKRSYHISRVSTFSDKLWYHGVSVGNFRGEFIVDNDFFYKQMICGVLDGVTILKSAQLIIQKEGGNWFTNTIPKEVINQSFIYLIVLIL